MSAQYPFPTPLTPQEWYCRADSTICIKSWAGIVVIEYAPSVHDKIPRLMRTISALYNQTTIPYMYVDYDANRNVVAQDIAIYVRVMVQNGALMYDVGAPPAPDWRTAVRQIIFYTLPYRRDLKEVVDTV